MNVNQDYLTQITELKAANLALEKEIKTLKLAQATLAQEHILVTDLLTAATGQ